MLTQPEEILTQGITRVLRSQARLAESQEQLLEFLCAMARVLQMELSLAKVWERIPHGPSLEIIMRAVGAGIENDPKMHDYIREKIAQGVPKLLEKLGPQATA